VTNGSAALRLFPTNHPSYRRRTDFIAEPVSTHDAARSTGFDYRRLNYAVSDDEMLRVVEPLDHHAEYGVVTVKHVGLGCADIELRRRRVGVIGPRHSDRAGIMYERVVDSIGAKLAFDRLADIASSQSRIGSREIARSRIAYLGNMCGSVRAEIRDTMEFKSVVKLALYEAKNGLA
jgi:hypothetical protein